MKVSELIKKLQELDPNDEAIVCVENHPVSSVSRMPWYWDGRLEFIERDKTHTPIKVGYKDTGSKIKIYYDTLEDALMDNPDAELDLSGITYQGQMEPRYQANIERWKQDGYEFQEWKKNNIIESESGKRPEIKISFRTKFTNWLRKLKLID